MVSDPMRQAVEGFHAADSMFHGNTDSRMRLIMFHLSSGESRFRVIFRLLRSFMR